MQKVKIYDTTLRDGTQSPDVNLSVRDKIEIVKALDEFGIDYIELGWPGSNPKDMESFLLASTIQLKNAKVSAFGSTRKINLTAEEDPNLKAILASKAHVACIFGKTWLDHVKKQLNTTGEENLKAISDSVRFLKKNNLLVFYDLEHFFDGFKDDKDYALSCIKTAAHAGADCLVLCDTNGGCLPEEIVSIIKETTGFMKQENMLVELGIHTHNDAGFAVANSIAAFDTGVTHIQGTINGLGERTGNADLTLIIPTLAIKRDVHLDVNLKELKRISDLVYTLANMKPNSQQPYVGRNAFSHKAGVHVDAVAKGARYEHIEPESVGNKREIVLSDLSGKANIVEVLKKFGISVGKDDPRVKNMLTQVEAMEKKGYGISNLKPEQALLVDKYFGNNKEFFTIKTWKIVAEQKNGEYSECIITGTVDGKDHDVAAAVNGGPVDATYQSLMKMIALHYKKMQEVKLVNYKVMIAEDNGAESSVRVYIEFKNGEEEWGTAGVSTNILEASLEAIEKGFKYYLIKYY